MGQENDYVHAQYLPPDFTFKEPSKLSKTEAYERLKFWYDRQQDPGVKVFEFHCFRGSDGNAVPVGTTGMKKRPAPRKRKRGTKGKRPARDVPTTEESSPSEDESAGGDVGGDAEDKSDEDDEEEEEDENLAILHGRKAEKQVTDLPFSAVPAKRTITAPPKPKNRYQPAKGPQFEKPVTRRGRRQVEVEEDREEGPSRKRQKKDQQVEKVGPPVGVPKDQPTTQRPRKAKAKSQGK
jgi:hypothetical protein